MGFNTIVRIALLLLPVSPVLAAQPDSWKGLTLGQTSVAEARQALGSPEEDESGEVDKLIGRRSYFELRAMFKERRSDKIRLLEYKNVSGFDHVALIFKEDRLVVIHLQPADKNKILAREFPQLYEDTQFRSIFDEHDFWGQTYGISQSTGEIRPKTYPIAYQIVGLATDERSIVLGRVANAPGFGRVIAQSMGAADSDRPGKIERLDLISSEMFPPRPMNSTLE